MAILYNKAPSPIDNITYLMQKASEGRKKTPAEMQAIRDEINRQNMLMGVKTKAVIVPEGQEFNPEYMDQTDNIALIGAPTKQAAFLAKIFPKDRRYIGWSGGSTNLGLSDRGQFVSKKMYPGRWGVVDTETAVPSMTSKLNKRVSPEQLIAYGLRHEVGHSFAPSPSQEGHFPHGMMEGGQESWNNLYSQKKTIDELLDPTLQGNKVMRDYIIKYRQHDNPELEASDNYLINKARIEKEKERAVLHATATGTFKNYKAKTLNKAVPLTNGL